MSAQLRAEFAKKSEVERLAVVNRIEMRKHESE